jgi:hypothetical protein
MKKCLLPVFLCLAFLLILTSCVIPTGPSTTTTLPGTTTTTLPSTTTTTVASGISGALTDQSFWGHWLRMDKEERWYFSDAKSFKDGIVFAAISSFAAGKITAGTFNFAKQSENVLKANDGEFFLYRNGGAQGKITGKVTTDATSAKGLGGITSVSFVVQNVLNNLNKTETMAAVDGAFTVQNIIPTDSYKIQTKVKALDGKVTDGPSLDVTPQTSADDIGTINLTPTLYNFKISGIATDYYLYADGTSYPVTITVKNIGTGNSLGTRYEIPAQDGLIVSSTTTSILGSIVAGGTKTIAAMVSCPSFSEEYADRNVVITLVDMDADGNVRRWQDSVPLRFYQSKMLYKIASIRNPIYGIILSPEKKGTWFSTIAAGTQSGVEYFSTNVSLPLRNAGYLISVSRAAVETESVYSIGIDTEPTPTSTMAIFVTTEAYEPNNTEDKATPMAVGVVLTAYLHMGDIDFYSVGEDALSLIFTPPPGTYPADQTIAISGAGAGATIYYTTDGSYPTTSSSVYSQPIAVTGHGTTRTIKAFAIEPGKAPSSIGSATFIIDYSAAAIPVFSPVGNTYTSDQAVSIACATPDASIYYTLDGTTPTMSSTVYTAPIAVAGHGTVKTIKAIAKSPTSVASSVASATYAITYPSAATPTFSPVGGTYTIDKSVAISSTTAGASIYYTVDGTTPTTASTLYSSAISVAGTGTTRTIKAIATAPGYLTSAVGTGIYTINYPSAATPTFSPVGETYTIDKSVAISSTTAGASIYYTVDGTTPTTASTLYSSAISVAGHGTVKTIKAIANSSTTATSSVATALYTISYPTVTTPTFIATGGTYSVTQMVTISTTTSGASLRYTINGNVPTNTIGTLYSGAITVSSTQTIKAIAYKTGCLDSSIGSATYAMLVSTPIFSPPAGAYSSAQTVMITTITSDTSIRYTTDGTIPTNTTGILYSTAIDLTATQILKAIAYKTGCTDSSVGTAVYAISGPAGGLIFYDKGFYSDSWRYLEAAPTDQGTSIAWWNGSNILTGAAATAIGTGKANTLTIVTAQGAGSYPASLCDNLLVGGYSDWFLPSRDELNLMYFNLKTTGFGGFESDYYWSSSEANIYQAWVIDFRGLLPSYIYKGSNYFHVRAVRSY